jgi:kynurenine formamidase
MSALLITIGILLVLILIVAIVRNSMYPFGYYDDGVDEEITTTTTTTTTFVDTPAVAAPATTGLNINGIPIVGMLVRQFEGTQPFVIDPVDKDKVFLNTRDDIYEDGAGKMWGLQ